MNQTASERTDVMVKLAIMRLRISISHRTTSLLCPNLRILQTPRSFSTSRHHKAPAEEYNPFATPTVESSVPPSPPVPKSRSSYIDFRLTELGKAAAYQNSSRPADNSDGEPYHLNVYAHKHNMHITFTRPSRDPILSFSSGNLGFRKAQRSQWDTCYQVAGYTLRKMMEKQWRKGGNKSNSPQQTMSDVSRLEVIVRGFGPGRDAFQKALLGPEGRLIKQKIVRVTDATRLKFGGCRSPNVRRLG